MTKRVLAIALLAGLSLAACGGGSDSSEARVKNGKPTVGSPAPRTKNAALPARTTLPPRPAPTTVPRATATTQPKTTTTQAKPPTTPAAPTPLAPVAVPTTAAPTTAPNSCTAQGPCKVGQTGPAGGIVFYAATTPQSWGQYMEVRPEAVSYTHLTLPTNREV